MQQNTCFLCRESTKYSLGCLVDECHYKIVVFSLKIEKRKRTKKVQLVFPSHSPILLNPLFNAVLWFMKWTSPLLPFTQKRRTTKLQLHYTAIVTHTDYWRLKSPFKIERIENTQRKKQYHFHKLTIFLVIYCELSLDKMTHFKCTFLWCITLH